MSDLDDYGRPKPDWQLAYEADQRESGRRYRAKVVEMLGAWQSGLEPWAVISGGELVGFTASDGGRQMPSDHRTGRPHLVIGSYPP